jgi:hypothetical protein
MPSNSIASLPAYGGDGCPALGSRTFQFETPSPVSDYSRRVGRAGLYPASWQATVEPPRRDLLPCSARIYTATDHAVYSIIMVCQLAGGDACPTLASRDPFTCVHVAPPGARITCRRVHGAGLYTASWQATIEPPGHDLLPYSASARYTATGVGQSRVNLGLPACGGDSCSRSCTSRPVQLGSRGLSLRYSYVRQ